MGDGDHLRRVVEVTRGALVARCSGREPGLTVEGHELLAVGQGSDADGLGGDPGLPDGVRVALRLGHHARDADDLARAADRGIGQLVEVGLALVVAPDPQRRHVLALGDRRRALVEGRQWPACRR